MLLMLIWRMQAQRLTPALSTAALRLRLRQRTCSKAIRAAVAEPAVHRQMGLMRKLCQMVKLPQRQLTEATRCHSMSEPRLQLRLQRQENCRSCSPQVVHLQLS